MSNTTQNAGNGNKPATVTRNAIAEVAKKMDSRIAVYLEETKGASPSTKALFLATCITDLRQIMNAPEIVKLIRALANTPLGFMCDKPNKRDQSVYSDGELLEACCEALIRGYYLTGNEFNIIAGRFYAAKNGLQRKVFSLPGLDGFFPEFSVPIKTNGDSRMHVTAKAKFVWRGQPTEMARTFAVNVFDGPASTDAALGKAERKFLAAVYQKLTNEIEPISEIEDLAESGSGQDRADAGESKAETVHKQLTAGQTEYVKTSANPEPEKVAEKVEENKTKETASSKPAKNIFDQIDDEHEKALRMEQQREQFRNSAGK